MEIRIKFISNTEDNRAELQKNAGYVVVYWDSHLQKERLTSARWDGEKFIYCSQKFIRAGMTPTFKKKLHRHHIKGWARIIDGRLIDD